MANNVKTEPARRKESPVPALLKITKERAIKLLSEQRTASWEIPDGSSHQMYLIFANRKGKWKRIPSAWLMTPEAFEHQYDRFQKMGFEPVGVITTCDN